MTTVTLDFREKPKRRENSETTAYQSESSKLKTLEQRISNLEEENAFLKKYNQKLKIDLDCIELDPKIQNSFYQNIAKKYGNDAFNSNEELMRYKNRITELKLLIQKLQMKNEYLVKLVNKYRAMVPMRSQNLTPSFDKKDSASKISRHRLKSSCDMDSLGFDSKESNSSLIKSVLIHHTKSESLQSKGAAGPINVLEQLHSIISAFDNWQDATEWLGNKGNFRIWHLVKTDLKLLLKWDKINIILVDPKLVELYRHENKGDLYWIIVRGIPMEVVIPKNM